MKADYDSEADAIMIEIEEVDHWDHGVLIDDAEFCDVAFQKGRPVAICLRYPRTELRLLDEAADRFDLDGEALRAATGVALALPDREITIEVGRERRVDSAPQAA
jgi:hypothetical protein